MDISRRWLAAAFAVASGFAATTAFAQTTNATIAGHVEDSQGLALPGVAVNVSSPNLQGVRSAVTSANGDYVFTLLPPGHYTIEFELSGFQRQQRTVTIA